MLLQISVSVTGVDSTIGPEVQKRVQNMSDLGGRQIRRLVVTTIDTPSRKEC